MYLKGSRFGSLLFYITDLIDYTDYLTAEINN